MAKTETTTSSRVPRFFRPFQLENAFLIFAIIYVPVAVLFFNRGVLAETLLIMYTFILSLMGILMIVRFILFWARSANEHGGQYGSVLIMYILNFLIPILTFKYIAYTVWRLLPCTCERFGLFADSVRMIRDMYFLFNLQTHLTILAGGSIVLMAIFTMWSIGRNK